MKTEITVNEETINYTGLPKGLRAGVERYLIHGIVPGNLLRSVIVNDLSSAVLNTDDENILLLRDIVKWFINYAPPRSYGSCKLMDSWARLRQENYTQDVPALNKAQISRVMAEMGRKGGKIGGKHRADRMTPEERSKSASKAARIRWGKDLED